MTEKPTDTRTQIDRFRETARQLGCDEDEAAFRDKLRVIARQKPEPSAKKRPKPVACQESEAMNQRLREADVRLARFRASIRSRHH